MFQLVYASKAAHEMSKDDLVEILAQSRRNNEPLDITGMLLYKNGRFIQVLEGPEAAVRELYETIKQDERHEDVVTLIEGDLSVREFPEWAMGFHELTEEDLEGMEGASLFMEGQFDPLAFDKHQSKAKAFLEVFRGISQRK